MYLFLLSTEIREKCEKYIYFDGIFFYFVGKILGKILRILTVLIENLSTLTRVPRNREKLIALLSPR